MKKAKAFLAARWENLVMANYEIDPTLLAPYTPVGTELDLFEGKMYVSLVGFMFMETKVFGVPAFGMRNFEEINLRFYVIRKEGGELRRGVVFINETVPYRIVAKIANWLYKEHYTAIPTRHEWRFTDFEKEIGYHWEKNKVWNHIKVIADRKKTPMMAGSAAEFILEHYYGYTKASENQTIEYEVAHPRWLVNEVKKFDINVDFGAMYGKEFAHLSHAVPNSVFLAEGSEITVGWKRRSIYTNTEMKL